MCVCIYLLQYLSVAIPICLFVCPGLSIVKSTSGLSGYALQVSLGAIMAVQNENIVGMTAKTARVDAWLNGFGVYGDDQYLGFGDLSNTVSSLRCLGHWTVCGGWVS